MADVRRSLAAVAGAALLLGAASAERRTDLLADGLSLWLPWIGVPYHDHEGTDHVA